LNRRTAAFGHAQSGYECLPWGRLPDWQLGFYSGLAALRPSAEWQVLAKKRPKLRVGLQAGSIEASLPRTGWKPDIGHLVSEQKYR